MKDKNQPVLTHSEVLCFAIRMAYVDWRDFEDRLSAIGEKSPDFAQKMRDDSTIKEKLIALLQLYKLETGTDYGIDVQ